MRCFEPGSSKLGDTRRFSSLHSYLKPYVQSNSNSLRLAYNNAARFARLSHFIKHQTNPLNTRSDRHRCSVVYRRCRCLVLAKEINSAHKLGGPPRSWVLRRLQATCPTADEYGVSKFSVISYPLESYTLV